MRSPGRVMASLIAAMGILTVSATCSSAGCLIPMLTSPSHAPRMACCASPGEAGENGPVPDHSRDKKPSHCPVCDQPLFNGGSIDKTTHLPAANAAALFVSLPLDPAIFDPTGGHLFPRLPGTSPPIGPPTLLHLHCALII